MIQQNIYSPDQGTQKNPGNSAFVSKLDPALKQLGSSMKQRSETRKGASRPIALSSKVTSHFGTWNVRTMFQGGKSTTIANEMSNYKLTILGVSETRWTQSGQIRLLSGHTVIYSGHQAEDAPHTEGVAVFMDKEAHKAMISWEPVSPRIITAKFRTSSKNIDLFVVQCYAPTNDADDATKQDFYNLLQAVLDTTKQKDLVILMGDFNAKVGEDNKRYETIMGQQGLG